MDEFADEVVALLRDLAAHPRPAGDRWWETPGYAELMGRKADLVARIRAANPDPDPESDGPDGVE